MKISDVEILEQVKDDLVTGRLFYNSIENGIGDYFFDSLISDIESLRLYAGIHNKQWSLYKMLARRFPFAVYYIVREETAIVIAVLDLRSNPSWNREKLRSRH